MLRYAGNRGSKCNTLFAPWMYARKAASGGSAPLVKRLYPELACSTLDQAIDQAKRRVLESDKTIMLRADACSRNRNQVRTKYRCWIDERGAFNELALV